MATSAELDDLDDLDDILEEFGTEGPAPPPVASGTRAAEAAAVEHGAGAAEQHAAVDAAADGTHSGGIADDIAGEFSEEDFARQLQSGMEDMIKSMQANGEQRVEFERLLSMLQSTTGGEEASAAASNASHAAEPEPLPQAELSFEDSITAAMGRLKMSNERASEANRSNSNTRLDGSGGDDEFLAQMLQALVESGGGDNPEDFGGLLEGLADQLMQKDLIYEPLKELNDMYPGWIEKNAGKYPPEEVAVYRAQSAKVREIVDLFDDPNYSDDNTAKSRLVREKMMEMQEIGNLPEDLMSKMAPGMDAAGLASDKNCTVM